MRRAIFIVVMLSVVAIGYIYKHSWSVRVTRELVEIERRGRIAVEEVDSLKAELNRLESFCRLDSLVRNNKLFSQNLIVQAVTDSGGGEVDGLRTEGMALRTGSEGTGR